MEMIKIDKKDWNKGLDRSRKTYRLVGPVKRAGEDLAGFYELADKEHPDMGAADTVLSAKSVVYPQTEVMFRYTTDKNSPDCNRLKRPAADYSPRAVIGIRPYDAAAILMLKKNFDTPDYRDPYWCDAYEACTFVGLAVDAPSSTDFSTSTGSGPFSEKGLDVLLVDMAGHYLAKVLTDKGAAYMKAAGWQRAADAKAAAQQIEKKKKAAEALIVSSVSFDKIARKSILDLYKADFWDDVAFSCINCGTCTYVCPTCWCFDIQDESKGKTGVRYKNWDSCMYPLFSLHGSGHNPRGTKTMRARQRFMHKLKYFLDKYDDGIMCVGCGRCVRSCPVNIDIRRVCELMNRYGPDPDACAV
ncbi:MAG: 4Fe-4S ferredoxin [Deltaproteobacteria bacterium SG8_13]|nr:MAG: 4Fe-4S ferredoxin [Deltaproteobacteria bacterium SG8_13]